jgi:hypothetical protein
MCVAGAGVVCVCGGGGGRGVRAHSAAHGQMVEGHSSCGEDVQLTIDGANSVLFRCEFGANSVRIRCQFGVNFGANLV